MPPPVPFEGAILRNGARKFWRGKQFVYKFVLEELWDGCYNVKKVQE